MLPGSDVLSMLNKRIGAKALQSALDPGHSFPGPVRNSGTPAWLKSVNMAGVNVRTIQSFWNVVKYALTLPQSQSAIHLLPIWEPGVVGSLYGMTSWRINREFFSPELATLVPALHSVEKQLKVAVNLLHALGKTVGMDVIPHTDRYSEIVLANPRFFEWLQRKDTRIADHSATLHEKVETAILNWLIRKGPAIPAMDFPEDPEMFFAPAFGEERRNLILFGRHEDFEGRNHRRTLVLDELFRQGFEPVPATMGPPYRGLEVDPRPEASVTDSEGRVWRDYRIIRPQFMSRVFGPLTRYRFYEPLNDNRDWQLDFSRPNREVWDYFCAKYAAIQAEYGFDFMRGDMSHVQMRPEGVPAGVDDFYDPHKAVRNHIRKKAPYFGYFAETFLAGPGVMAYGNEYDHLEASDADSTLGDLQSMAVGSARFMAAFSQYLDLSETRRFAPNFTLMTADKDDPRFDRFYLNGNEARFFTGLFLTDWPSYMGLGFELRDIHRKPAQNEYYTKLYVFQISDGPKSTAGPYRWGGNMRLFNRLNRIRQLAEAIFAEIREEGTRWLIKPDPLAGCKVIAWTQQKHPRYLFVVNLDGSRRSEQVLVPRAAPGKIAGFRFSTHQKGDDAAPVVQNEYHWFIPPLKAGEGRCYELKAEG